MDRATEQKIVLVTQKTRLEGLVKRYNTKEQAQFYIEHHGGNFDDYILEDKIYYQSVDEAKSFLQSYGRLHILDRENMPNYLFGKMDLVVVFDKIDNQSRMTIISQMPENGVIFSDGGEQDFIEFNSGTSVAIGIANKNGNLVI